MPPHDPAEAGPSGPPRRPTPAPHADAAVETPPASQRAASARLDAGDAPDHLRRRAHSAESNAPRAYAPTLADLKRPARTAMWWIAGFSALINVLMLTTPIYMLQIYDRVLTSGRSETLALLTLLAVAALIVLGLLDGLRASMASRMGGWLVERAAPICLAAEMRRAAHGGGSEGHAQSDISRVNAFLSSANLSAFFDAPWAPIFVALVWLLHPYLGMVAAAAAVVLFLLSLANEHATRGSLAEATRRRAEAQRAAGAMLRSAEEVRALGMQGVLTERWREENMAATEAAQLGAERGSAIVAFTKFVRMAVQVAILGVGAMLVIDGQLTAGAMVAASILLGRALAPVEQVMGAWRALVAARQSYARIQELVEAYPPDSGRTSLPAPDGALEAKALSVADPTGSRLLLNEVSFRLEPGDALAVIGPSGAGKSTLCRMLIGAHAARRSGQILLDGARLDLWEPDRLGAAIGYMPQSVELFAGSVRENISRFSRASDDEVLGAARAAHAHDLIMGLPAGYDTLVGPGGLALSGGQRQRIGLARALFGAPALIILDEPNANLDGPGEAALVATIRRIKERGATVVIVGHRGSTVAEADQVLLLQNGSVADLGPRDEVLARLRAPSERAAKAESEKRAAAEAAAAEAAREAEIAREKPKAIAGAPLAAALSGAWIGSMNFARRAAGVARGATVGAWRGGVDAATATPKATETTTETGRDAA